MNTAAEEEYQTLQLLGSSFQVSKRYTVINPIGTGAYGNVVAAVDEFTGNKVAIKKISKVFDNTMDAKRVLRELVLLRFLQHENVIHLTDVMMPPTNGRFEDIYLVSELMETDLHLIINSPQELNQEHCQYFMYQIFRGLKYIHSARILHRDLKPSNLLVNSNCDLKICDFGLARVADTSVEEGGLMTEYVATRWYRAPEIMLSWQEYTCAIDVWAAGCIFAELLQRQPLFPGKDYREQLLLIVSLLGPPSEDELMNIESEMARSYIRDLPRKAVQPWAQRFPRASAPALDLVDKLLRFDPRKRATVEQALAHEYFRTLHDPMDEPVTSGAFNYDFNTITNTTSRIKELVFQEMCYFHPNMAAAASMLNN